MNKGKLRACGSSLFLKNHFGASAFFCCCTVGPKRAHHTTPHAHLHDNNAGVGYSLTIEKRPEANAARIQRFVLNHLPEARLLSCVGAEISFQLPRQAAKDFKV